MITDRRTQAILTLFGVSAGVATGLWLWRRGVADRERALRRWAEPRGSAQGVADALREDARLARRGITVDAVAEGVVELTGAVRNHEEADRAVQIAQRTTGVYTVVNRLRVDEEEARRNETSRRWNEGAPELRERHHYGVGVGMGTRRQSPDTDPDRPSDKQKILDRELDVGSVDDEADVPTRDPNTGSRVESTRVKPGDERSMEEAGLKSHPDNATSGEGEDAGPSDQGEDGRPGATGS